MNLLRTTARTLLAAVFAHSGLDTIRTSTEAPEDIAHGALQVGASIGLATGVLRRPSAAVLAGTLVPATPAGRRAWVAEEGESSVRRVLTTAGLLGGLVIAAMDTEGQPGAVWRAEHAMRHAELEATHAGEVARLRAEVLTTQARARQAEIQGRIAETTGIVRGTTRQARRDARLAVRSGRTASRATAALGRGVTRAVTAVSPR